MDTGLRHKWLFDSLSSLMRIGDVNIVIFDLGGIRTVIERQIYVTQENGAILEYVDDVEIVSRNDENQINRALDEVGVDINL